MLKWFSFVKPASDFIGLEELGHDLNDLNQCFELQINKSFNILSGYLSPPTRMPPIAGYSTCLISVFLNSKAMILPLS